MQMPAPIPLDLPTRTITPRKPKFDFATVPKHWFAGSRVASHIANGVNMLFPHGERFFVRSVNHFLDQIDDPELVARARGFFGQEGRHASAHDDYNDMLRHHGFEIDGFLAAFQKWGTRTEEAASPELRLACTAAAEHFTAIMAENAFRQRVLDTAHPVMRDLLLWHAAEEIEHKSVAFDVLQKVNPSYALRIAGLAMATLQLSTWWTIGFLTLLRQEGMSLAELRAELRAMRSRPQAPDEGIAKRVFLRGIRSYLRRDFHPDDHDNYHLAETHLAQAGLA
jgi:uncharacterized protein